MSNQIALLVHTRPGDEVVIGEGAHVAFYESGAGAALAGVQFAQAGAGGLFDADELSRAVKPKADYHPRTSLVCLENTHNRAGGRVFPQPMLEAVVKRAREHGLAAHLDGARLWHAALATGLSEAELARPFDTVSVCFSKAWEHRSDRRWWARRARCAAQGAIERCSVGACDRPGILAAGALFALEHQRQRLSLDHDSARVLARRLAELPGVRVVPPETEHRVRCARRAERGARGR